MLVTPSDQLAGIVKGTNMKFRKRPVVIEAVRWDGSSGTANAFLGERYGVDWEYAAKDDMAILIPTLEGKMRGEVNDWIIKGIKGEFYPCKPDIFAATYEPVVGAPDA